MKWYLLTAKIIFLFIGTSNAKLFHHQRHHKTKHIPLQEESILPTHPTPQFNNPTTKSTDYGSTESLLLKVGNRTISTNLQNAFDDIAPGKQVNKFSEPISKSNLFTNPINKKDLKTSSSEIDITNKKNTSSLIFEVIDIAPIFKHHTYRVKLIIVTSLYATLGLAIIFVSYCFAKIVIAKKKRHKQYMLLTKRDLEFPLGGGGI